MKRDNALQRSRTMPLRELVTFAVLGTVMFVSFAVMQGLPNMHLIGVFIGAITLTYRVRALIPIYVYVLLYGIFSGFSFFWLPYLYIWLPLWLAFMLAGRYELPKKVKMPLYMAICALHGLTFGLMYAPAQALFFGLSFNGMLAWVAAGLWFDVLHAASNLFLGALILPLTELLKKLKSQS